MKDKKALIIQFNTALSSVGIQDKELKQEMVFNVSSGRATSSKDLTEKELQTLIQRLNEYKQPGTIEYSKENTLRKRIISKFREMGYNTWSDAKQRQIANMERIEAVVLDKWKKKLNDYTVDELSKIIAVLENQWLPNYYKNKGAKNG